VEGRIAASKDSRERFTFPVESLPPASYGHGLKPRTRFRFDAPVLDTVIPPGNGPANNAAVRSLIPRALGRALAASLDVRDRQAN
jgi:hypothetical protein